MAEPKFTTDTLWLAATLRALGHDASKVERRKDGFIEWTYLGKDAQSLKESYFAGRLLVDPIELRDAIKWAREVRDQLPR